MDSPIWNYEPTSEELVADKLRTHFIEGRLPVGEFLSQRKLAELAGSSVISVRGALRQLENEGLVENVPRLGVRIPVETPTAVRDRYFMRHILESAAVERIAGNMAADTALQLLRLARKLDELATPQSESTYPPFAAMHVEFHLLIAHCAASPLLEKQLKRVINPSLMMLNAKRSWQAPSEIHADHVALANRIIQGPAEEAVADMQRHIRQGLESELAAL
jgi:DNA-binding GntR family transcriptional regulator